jgi:hypothetical protein
MASHTILFVLTPAQSGRGRVFVVVGAIAFGLLLSACSSPASQPPVVTQSTTSAVTQSTTPAASATAAGTTGATGTATPTTASGGSLRVSADVDLGALSAQGQPVAAEGPDGTVFYADGEVVMVVSGVSAPQVAEHPGAKVLALGASSSALYVVTPQALIAYSRSDGDQTGRWALTGSPATPTTAGVAVGGNDDIWVWTDWATDSSGYQYAMLYVVQPGAARADIVGTSAEPGTLTTDGTHAFFLVASKNSLGASLIEATPAAPGGSPAVSLQTAASAPTLALVSFSQSQVVLYSQPDSLYTYTPGSAGAVKISTHAGLPVGVAGTSSGLLFLTCAKVCVTVTEVDQSTGTSGPSLTVPANSDILLGPDPAVVGVESGHLHLVRLG